MNWDNHGSYRKHTWNDDDSSTWSWQIDHIIPQSDLPYTSMAEENFHKSWALNNLRPLSAKQNLLDGARKIRHKII
jgi:5-methylcytosine-specific restriction endonuclease McrA